MQGARHKKDFIVNSNLSFIQSIVLDGTRMRNNLTT